MTLALLPDTLFADLSSWLLVLIALAALAAVIKGADWLVESAAGLALKLGLPKIIVGATIVSLGTTSPEMAVSVLAAWQGNSGLALGNGVGSIIVDTGLIFALGCLMVALPADRFILQRQGLVQIGSAVLLAAICYALYAVHGEEAALGRWVGILLVSLLVAYLVISVRWARQHPDGIIPAVDDDDLGTDADPTVPATGRKTTAALLATGGLGLLIVVFAGDALVQSVGIVSVRWGVPQVVVAATLVAFGTSLPELIVGITSIRRGHPELLVGNVIGADILNVLFVIGFAALAAPLHVVDPTADVPTIFLLLHLPTLLIILLVFRLYIVRATRTGNFSRWMGWPLLAMYIAYVAAQFALA
jgi:cation:H+ antiporter